MESKKIGGIISLIGAILTFVAPLLPVAYLSYFTQFEIYYWIWGCGSVTYLETGESNTFFIPENCGIICGIVILVVAIISLDTSRMVLLNKTENKKAGKILLLMAILALLAMISWIILINIIYSARFCLKYDSLLGCYYYSFWEYYTWSYGIYILFIGTGVLALGSVLVLKS